MIVVTGTTELHPDDADKAVGYALEVMRETSREKGCIVYRFYRDLENPGLFRVYEEWETEDDLKAHLATPHLAAFRERLGALRIVARAVKLLEVSGERAL